MAIMENMIASLIATAALAQAAPATYLDSRAVAGVKVREAEARAAMIFFTPDPNTLLTLSRDGELRWIDIRKPQDEDTIRRKQIGEVPIWVMSPKQKKELEELRKNEILLVFGENAPKMQAQKLRILGDKEFALTDRHDEVFFYSTETGELLRKFKLKALPDLHTGLDLVSPNNEYVSFSDTERRVQMVYKLSTGEKLFEVPRTFLETCAFLSDNKRFAHLADGKLTIYSLETKKVLETIKLPEPKTANLVASPVANVIAYNTMTASYNYEGITILNLDTKKVTQGSKELREFGCSMFSPDGKTLLLSAEKWINSIDVATGAHKNSMRPYFTAMWDVIHSLDMNGAGDKIILVNDPNNTNIDLPYSILIDLKGKPADVVKYPIKRG